MTESQAIPATKGRAPGVQKNRYTDEPYERTEEEKNKEREAQRERALRSYYKNKEAILARRKKRYDEDPEFRAKALAASAEINKKRSLERRLKIKDERFVAETPKQFRIDLPDGKYIVQEMFTTTQLAMQLERKASSIITWEKMGLLPQPLYKGLNNFRLYTQFQVTEIVRIYSELCTKHGRRRMTNRVGSTDFFERVKELWEKFPLGVDTGLSRED